MTRTVVYWQRMLTRVWIGIAALLAIIGFGAPILVSAQVATVGGACITPIDGHTCTDVSGVSATDRTARDCQTGHCPGTPSSVLCCRAAASAPTPSTPSVNELSCAQYICTLGEGYSNETLTRLPPTPTGVNVPASYACAAILDPSDSCRRSCDYACGLYRRGEPGITTPYRCASTYHPRCVGPQADTVFNASATPTAEAADPGKPGRLGLPPCATSHDPSIAGRCSLDDIKTVAVNFANFLMGLAAAFFLAIFVWAGFKYIFFAYDSGVAADAKKTLTGAAIGMLLVLGAAMIVRFVQTAATGRTSVPVSSSKTGVVPAATAPSGSPTRTP